MKKRGDSFAKPKPELIIHIGSPKTGSSSLQRAFENNREFLESEGVFYPLSMMTYTVGLELYHLLNCKIVSNIIGDTWKLQIARYIFERSIMNNVAKFKKHGYSKMLISGEILFGRILTLDCLERAPSEAQVDRLVEDIIRYRAEEIKRLFKDFDIKIACYLRRQDLYLESLYFQAIKEGIIRDRILMSNYYRNKLVSRGKYDFATHQPMTLFDLWCQEYSINTYYYDILEAWADVFGKENIVVKAFEKGQMKEGLVKGFFADVLGISPEHLANLQEQHINEKLHRDVIEYIASFEKLPANFRFNSVRETSNKLDGAGKYHSLFSGEERTKLMEHHREGNEKIAREYLGRKDGVLFYDKVNTDDPEPYPGLSEERRAFIENEINPPAGNKLKDAVSSVVMSAKSIEKRMEQVGSKNSISRAAKAYTLAIFKLLKRSLRLTLRRIKRKEWLP